ncbi:multidrug transporter subunit MdtC [Pandoraea cepalis]|uniref:Multidrug transporter subunit MdtC n=1 Tax=Pandoraea cepalis TaxID=2508294 RepID=A0AAW7MQB5_9BURK|nr:multidrug efflux RND transporter permease subunit [Pandoraea cepalis]MDN4574966.1 multidrug transporter subunit MdtC [Pandoraea cepalis]MDN4579036.1 multidrug transporter subunit MdtC [Pandoraea cepalis]
MNLSAVFIKRSVATVLLTVGVTLAGIVAFGLLPVSPLPQVDFPTISVTASLPGASPETMAASVATPLERSLGRIAGVTEMTSNSTLGSTRITLQFDLSRDINGAARDVQAAINAARSLLPSGLPSNPTYRKVNPASAPVMILALTSDSMTRGQMYDSASTILAQKISQLDGVGDVTVGGSSLPAVRVELNPTALNKYQIPLETVRTTIQAANANRPKGALEDGDQRWQILANDQAKTAKDYLPVVVSYRDGRPVRLSDVADVVDSVQDLRNAGSANGKPSVVLIITTQPGANIIKTVDGINKILPVLRASIPAAINLDVVMDRTPTIRASLKEVERTLLISIALVIMVVFLFLRNWRATLIPSVAVPVSLIGTFGVMYLCGFSLDNLSLMALTIATGFVVDDAIVVLENIARHIEDGLSPFAAALKGTREVGFTVLSMSISLVAVFIPLLLMGGIVGRLFREFAVTLSAAILVSLVVSLTATPMMCARLLKGKAAPGASEPPARPSVWTRVGGWTERMFDGMLREYERSLSWALRHGPLMLGILFATICLNVWLYTVVPKGFFPQQDTGRMIGFIQADQAISFQAMEKKLADFIKIVQADPDVSTVTGFTGGSNRNGGLMFVTLKPLGERKISADQVIARLRGKLAKEPGAMLYLQSVQDIRVGGRASNAQYQYTLQADDLQQLREWEPKVRNALSHLPNLVDVNTDQQDKGLQTTLDVDRDQASRLGLTMSQIDNVLNDAFGQRQVSTIYNPLNQYKVVMEVASQWWQSPESLKDIYVVTSAGAQVPLSAFARYRPTNTALGVSHQGQFAASTISFNLPPGVSLSQAQASVQDAVDRLGMPTSVHGSFQGTAQAFQSALSSQPILILTALLTVYIVLGVLYESYIHPLTILSTLPSAGVGALLALLLFNTEFSIIALIGVILLIGIVKKNAIMMIDFALDAERRQNMPPREAIYHACVLRFRPIMMTTMAAMLGAIPLALGTGDGAELRQPLGISIVGGLLVSQVLTLYTTPVVYLYLDRLRLRWARWRARGQRGQGDVGEVGHG